MAEYLHWCISGGLLVLVESLMRPPGACQKHPEILKYWDPTRIAVAQTCWRKHWLSNIRGLRVNEAGNIHFEWGHAYHECCQFFDDLLIAGNQRRHATTVALKKADELSWDAEEKQPRWGCYLQAVRCRDPEMVPSVRDPARLVENRKRCKWAKKWFSTEQLPGERCECGRPLEIDKTWFNAHPKKNRENLLAAVETYCKDPGLRPYKFPNRERTTEVQHIIPLPIQSPDGDPYRLVVNMDSIVDHKGWAAIRERKTTGLSKLDFKFWKTYMMGAQTDTYDLVGSIIYVDGERIPKLLIEATRLPKAGSGEVEIQREVVPISEERRVEWFEELLDVIAEAEERALKVLDFGEDPERAFSRNTSACHGQFGTCPYWEKLCTKASSTREETIANEFHVEWWDPLRAEVVMEEVE